MSGAGARRRRRRRVLSFDVGVRNLACCLVEFDYDEGAASANASADASAEAADAVAPVLKKKTGRAPSALRAARQADRADVTPQRVCVLAWTCRDITEGKTRAKVQSIDMARLCTMLLDALDDIAREWSVDLEARDVGDDDDGALEWDSDTRAVPFGGTVDGIVIEQQPRFNPRMKMMSAALFAWCHTRVLVPTRNLLSARHVVEPARPMVLDYCSPQNKNGTIVRFMQTHGVVYEPPKKRARVNKAPPVIVVDDSASDDSDDDDDDGDDSKASPLKSKSRYVLHKGQSVAACKHLLLETQTRGENDTVTALFERSKKQDDLADAFWQACWYWQNTVE